MSLEITSRNDLEPKYAWDLTDIYANDEDWEKDFGIVEAGLANLLALRGTLAESGSSLLKALQLRDTLYILVDRLHMVAHLRFDLNTTDSASQSIAERSERLQALYREAASFFFCLRL